MRPLAVSLGDPAGIGPELICEAWLRRNDAGLPPFVAVGGAELLAAAARRRGIDVPAVPVSSIEQGAAAFASGIPVFGPSDTAYRPGEPDRHGAAFALDSLAAATRLAIEGEASGIVTAPVAKSCLAEIGFVWPGQTEYVAEACGIEWQDAVMMLASPELKTVPLTVHCALSEVPGLLSTAMIVRRARIVAAGLTRDFGIEAPRLAVAGLNPHAGEGGKFGTEERDIIAPAIAELQALGIAATGPHPADGLFSAHERDRYDAALCMYHDQALIPLKTLAFDAGVNVTLGLPIIRTSPDHGTAFAIAGTGRADPGATISAIRMAGECAARRS